MYNYIIRTLFVFSLSNLFSQFKLDILPVYPNEYLFYMNKYILENPYISNSIFRPKFTKTNKNDVFTLKYNVNTFINNGPPNLENNGIIISNHGNTMIHSLKMTINLNYLYLSLSPTKYFINQMYDKNKKIDTYQYLNDSNIFFDKYPSNSINNSTLLLYYKSVGIGLSNENYWIGPGYHSSLAMSSNAPGFNKLLIRSMHDIEIFKTRVNFLYFFSELKEDDNSEPFYYTNLFSSLSFGNDPIIDFGFNRSYISGKSVNQKINSNEAALLVFNPLERTLDSWDQMIVGYSSLLFPKSKLKIYFEIGTDDSRTNLIDLRAHWDHASGILIGLQKYGIFDNEYIFYCFEYLSTKNRNTLQFYRGNRFSPNFYEKGRYNFTSYVGRKWGAHSGSDSDDGILTIGYEKNKFSTILNINFERHGIISREFPELKNEISFIFKYKYNKIISSIYFEKETIKNYNFEKNNSQNSILLGLGISYLIY